MKTYQQFKQQKYEAIPGDCPWNKNGFSHNDFVSPEFSEMSAHIPILEFLASKCDHVTEFGTRNCNSTVAFLSGAKKRVVSYDIQPTQAIVELLEFKKNNELPVEWIFKMQSTSDPNHHIEDTDLLFVDTLHTFYQVEQELKLHGDKVNKWIVFHDVYSQGLASMDSPGSEGINRAIDEYIEKTGCWKKVYQVNFNHGLLVIERVAD